jgi:hypothetical protein
MRHLWRSLSFTALACMGFAPSLTCAAQADPTDRVPMMQDSGDVGRYRARARFPVILPREDVTQTIPASRPQVGDCRQDAMEKLRASAPDGFAIYEQIPDKKFFVNWITCDDLQTGLATAVHESVHFITSESDAFPLVHGGEIKRPHQVSRFFAPSLIVGKFKPNDFVSTYLRPGSASSASDFLYLLDELNAYTHDLNAAIKLNALRRTDQDVDNRDGLAALMAFVALYAEKAEESEPMTWSGLQKPQVAKAVSELWGRAEKVMASSCGIPNFGTDDKILIRQFCQAKPQSSLQKILGRAPVCPTECLKPTRKTARLGDLETVEGD